jgi:hypothetical protein
MVYQAGEPSDPSALIHKRRYVRIGKGGDNIKNLYYLKKREEFYYDER